MRTIARKGRVAQPRRKSGAPVPAELPQRKLESWYTLKERLEELQLRARDLHALADLAETALASSAGLEVCADGALHRVLAMIAGNAFSLAADLDPGRVLKPAEEKQDEPAAGDG
jgi:hypothetical protein